MTMLDVAMAVSDRHVLSAWYTGAARLENYLCGQMVGVDFDNETKESAIEVVTSTRLINTTGGIVYSTQSSKPEKPRTRALFFLSRPVFDSDVHRHIARGLSGFLLSGRSETNPNRMFHGTGDEGRIIVLGHVLDFESAIAIADDYRDYGLKPVEEGEGPITATAQEIRQLLSKLPKWFADYNDWLQVLQAVHSVLPNEEGVRLIEEWSPGTPGEVAKKFKTFTRHGVTIKSLVRLAKIYETKS